MTPLIRPPGLWRANWRRALTWRSRVLGRPKASPPLMTGDRLHPFPSSAVILGGRRTVIRQQPIVLHPSADRSIVLRAPEPFIWSARRSLISNSPKMGGSISLGGRRHHFFCKKFFQNSFVEHRHGPEACQSRVHFIKRLQPLCFQRVHAAIFCIPAVDAGIAHTVLRPRAKTPSPASCSCSLKFAMMCSSLKPPRFTLWSSHKARAYFKTDKLQGARSKAGDVVSGARKRLFESSSCSKSFFCRVCSKNGSRFYWSRSSRPCLAPELCL